MKYYRVFFGGEESLGTGRARSPDERTLPESGTVVDWQALELDLVDGTFADYLANDLGLRLCSDRMRQVLDASASASDQLQWLPASVFLGNDARQYWVLHFPTPLAAFSGRTVWQDKFVVKPVLSAALLKDNAVFTFPGRGIALVINGNAKEALQRSACTGFECSPAATDP